MTVLRASAVAMQLVFQGCVSGICVVVAVCRGGYVSGESVWGARNHLGTRGRVPRSSRYRWVAPF